MATDSFTIPVKIDNLPIELSEPITNETWQFFSSEYSMSIGRGDLWQKVTIIRRIKSLENS